MNVVHLFIIYVRNLRPEILVLRAVLDARNDCCGTQQTPEADRREDLDAIRIVPDRCEESDGRHDRGSEDAHSDEQTQPTLVRHCKAIYAAVSAAT